MQVNCSMCNERIAMLNGRIGCAMHGETENGVPTKYLEWVNGVLLKPMQLYSVEGLLERRGQ